MMAVTNKTVAATSFGSKRGAPMMGAINKTIAAAALKLIVESVILKILPRDWSAGTGLLPACCLPAGGPLPSRHCKSAPC